jgi:hypothetical protein
MVRVLKYIGVILDSIIDCTRIPVPDELLACMSSLIATAEGWKNITVRFSEAPLWNGGAVQIQYFS